MAAALQGVPSAGTSYIVVVTFPGLVQSCLMVGTLWVGRMAPRPVRIIPCLHRPQLLVRFPGTGSWRLCRRSSWCHTPTAPGATDWPPSKEGAIPSPRLFDSVLAATVPRSCGSLIVLPALRPRRVLFHPHPPTHRFPSSSVLPHHHLHSFPFCSFVFLPDPFLSFPVTPFLFAAISVPVTLSGTITFLRLRQTTTILLDSDVDPEPPNARGEKQDDILSFTF